MSDENLKNLVNVGKLKAEECKRSEFVGLVTSAKRRLADARDQVLSPESRFDLAYNAAHGFALAALRLKGYRPNGRYLVFQALASTAGLGPEIWRVLAKCHSSRNLVEYEGYSEVDEKLLGDLIRCTTVLESVVGKLAPPPE